MTDYDIEVTKAEYREENEWEFVADVRTRIHNPDGSDVVTLRSFKARPKYDDLVHKEDHVHEHTEYWWPNSYPSQGDSPFKDSGVSFEADLSDDDELLEECIEAATLDPAAELDAIAYDNERWAKKLGKRQ